MQALLLSGVHRDAAGTQRGTAVAALLQVRAGGARVSLHLQGIPVISEPQRASAFYGQATPALGIVTGSLDYTFDRRGTFSVGVGGIAVNQRTPLPNLDQVVGSRLSGMRAELLARVPVGSTHFVEADVGVAPYLAGGDHFIYSDGSLAVDKPERASVTDATLAFGVRARACEWLVGWRAINFSAQFTRAGEAADRNAGVGVMIEWRALLAKSDAFKGEQSASHR